MTILDAHFRAWINDRCWMSEKIPIECRASALLASYRIWCRTQEIEPASAQAWGRWMRKHYIRVRRNSDGIGTVYLAIATKPVPQIVIPEI